MYPMNIADGESSGTMQMSEVEALRKSLEAGYGTDSNLLTQGAALRIQSLESTLLSTIQENKHFTLINQLETTNATATVDEWTEQSGIGGFLGGSTNTETGDIDDATGDYARRTGQVKYLMTRRQVSLVTTLQSAIADAQTVEYQNGAKQLLTDAEFLCFEGDSVAVPTEFDGIYKQMVDLGGTDYIIDAQATPLDKIDLINQAASTISGFGNFGTPTDLYISMKTQADFDNRLDPAFRVPLDHSYNGGIEIGTPVRGIRTSSGDIATRRDVFIRDEAQQMPFEVSGFAAKAAANLFAPAVVPTGVASSDVSSMFGAPHAGNYFYAVAGCNAKGQSVVMKSAQIAVAAGNKVVLTITASAGLKETGYVIYRSRKNGTNATTDFRQVARVGRTGTSTVFTDLNREIPGTSKAYLLNMSSGEKAITWRRLLPMMKFPLYATTSAIIPWAQLLFGYLRIGKRRHHVVIKNILPNTATWRPFG